MRLSGFFVCTTVLGGPSPSKRELVGRLLNLLVQQGFLPPAAAGAVSSAVLLREQLGSTGIGGGLAIPHAHHPAIPRPVGVLALARPPVEFDSIDGKPVDLIALCLTPPERPGNHLGPLLRCLEGLIRHLGNADFCRRVRRARSAEEMEELLQAHDGGMTRREWLVCSDPVSMLNDLGDRLSPRKRQLFACACLRRVWRLVRDETCRRAVEVAEQFADGRASDEEREDADDATARGGDLYSDAELAATFVPVAHLDFAGRDSVGRHPAINAVRLAALAAGPPEAALQAGLLRDIAGDPFRPVRVDPAWLAWEGGVAKRLAEAAYEERTFPSGTLDATRLAVLADALTDGGCTDADLLDHLRSRTPHVRGCHVVDALVGTW